MNRVAFGQHWDVVTPVICRCTKSMHQQDCRAIGPVLIRVLLNRVHGMTEVAPGDAIHSQSQVARC